ncbi:MAG TPA: transposase zinc-binding domain-containing protein [Vicinamibacteria bacterium]|nr:transposase zinc-binding domain-containing protein [Vicinamibacteria bacterium]
MLSGLRRERGRPGTSRLLSGEAHSPERLVSLGSKHGCGQRCGLLEHGFARLWCSQCRRSVPVAFSCRGRSFCPSCDKKRQILWAEWLSRVVLVPTAHRHIVLTIPRLLRPLFRRRRELPSNSAASAAKAVTELVRRGLGEEVRPGLVVPIAAAGDLVRWHPHIHMLTLTAARPNRWPTQVATNA